MRIYNGDDDKAINNVILLMTVDEIKEMHDSLENIINSNEQNRHYHINDKEYKHEITIAAYDLNNINDFHKRMIKLIDEDE
jgi:hypothetical protein